jgi:hypothetical protein
MTYWFMPELDCKVLDGSSVPRFSDFTLATEPSPVAAAAAAAEAEPSFSRDMSVHRMTSVDVPSIATYYRS